MDPTDLAFAPVARQAQLIATGELSARDLLEVYLDRIDRLDPQLNAFRVVFRERARLEATQADARREAGTPAAQRPLLGVPIAVKDDIDVAGEVTALGTNAYGDPAPADAEVVRRLREAGAVIIGKTNVPELCAWNFTETADLGRNAQPLGASAHARWLERGDRRGSGRRAGRAPVSAPTAPAPSASPPPGAGSSVSSPSAGASPWPRAPSPGTGSPSTAH